MASQPKQPVTQTLSEGVVVPGRPPTPLGRPPTPRRASSTPDRYAMFQVTSQPGDVISLDTRKSHHTSKSSPLNVDSSPMYDTDSPYYPSAPPPSPNLLTDSPPNGKRKLKRTDSSVVIISNNEEIVVPRRIAESIERTPQVGHRQRYTKGHSVDHGGNKTFARFVRSKLAAIKKLSLSENQEQVSSEVTTLRQSCPNLSDKEVTGRDTADLVRPLARHTRSAEGGLCTGRRTPHSGGVGSPTPRPSDADDSSPNLLTVPSFFGGQSPHRGRSQGGRGHGTQRHHSAPQLDIGVHHELIAEEDSSHSEYPRKTLEKSLSDTPRVPSHRTSASRRISDGDLLSTPAVHDVLKTYRSEARVWQIWDHLYIGNLESAYSQHVMCKYSITSLVDVSNIPPEDVPASKKNDIACKCSDTVKHQPAALRLSVSESDLVDIQSLFPQINKFIDGARSRKKNVLVFCYTGGSLSVLAVIQYLMTMCEMDLRRAYSQVMKGRSDIDLYPAYMDMLRAVDRLLDRGEVDPDTVVPRQAGGGPADVPRYAITLPREAWADC